MLRINTGSVWRHLKTKGIYKVIDTCTIEKTWEDVVLYQSIINTNGKTIVRPVEEFLDGRFEKLGNNSKEALMSLSKILEEKVKESKDKAQMKHVKMEIKMSNEEVYVFERIIESHNMSPDSLLVAMAQEFGVLWKKESPELFFDIPLKKN